MMRGCKYLAAHFLFTKNFAVTHWSSGRNLLLSGSVAGSNSHASPCRSGFWIRAHGGPLPCLKATKRRGKFCRI